MLAAKEDKYYRIGSLEKGIAILAHLAKRRSATLGELATGLGLPKTVCHRHLCTMRDLGFVEKQEGAGYRLTMKLFELAMYQVNGLEVRNVARPFLRELGQRFLETINLGILDGQEVVYLDKFDSREPLRGDLAMGTRIPLHCTALGKAILAHRPPDEAEDFLAGRPLRANTRHTITSVTRLREELLTVRARGYALDDEEHYLGVRCVAAPLRDHHPWPRYAISIAGPCARLSRQDLVTMSQGLMEVCERLSLRLGHGGGDHVANAGKQALG